MLVKTQISVKDINLLKIFLEANELNNVKINLYESTHEKFASIKYTNIEFLYDENDENIAYRMIVIALRYGSVEKGFQHYCNTIRRNPANGFVY
jgi:hypothetical protein